jgi:DNA polymerase-4
MLTTYFGVLGYHLKNMGKGEDAAPVRLYGGREQIKSVGHTHTLPRNTWDIAVIKSYLLMLSEKVGTRLREAGMMGRTVSLVVRYADFTTFSRQHNLKECIKDSNALYQTASILFTQILPLSQAVRLLGVSISSLLPDNGQPFLFEQYEKRRKLTEAVDSINKQYGAFTIKPSSLLIAEQFGIEEPCGMIGKYWMKK